VRIDRDTLLSISSIDGAVLIGPDTTCYAIGAILDGRAHGTGDPARGARYNSALRYVLSSEAPCLAVCVSEDGRVDLLCR
jgi:DNA integrity scanning protein DisA with diadenylate cyclase activity